ncbi:MAG: hypothetical protein JNL21_05700 [Myxococcales bacterium]|nr:hypothetical protein [Myxococcales bacterium]
MQLERLRELPLSELGASEDALDGPFLLPSGHFALLFSLRGKGGGAMPSPSELRWHRDLPPAARLAPIHLFLRRGDRALYLGAAELLKRSRPATDGYKLTLGLAEPLEEELWRQLVSQAQLALPPPAEEAIASLTKASTTGDRLAAMSVFVERWYGPAMSAPLMSELLPRPLCALHEATAGHRVFVQNRLVSPEGLVPGGEDGRLVFYVENQGVWTWATDPAGEDPPVYVRSNAPGAPWQKESDALAGFLIQVLLLEATFGAPFGASHDGLDARALSKLTKKVKALSIPSWSSRRFFASAGVIGFATPQGPETAVWIGAKERERLEPLEALLEDWPDVRV